MTTLVDKGFDDLQAGIKFKHPEHGEHIIAAMASDPEGVHRLIDYTTQSSWRNHLLSLADAESEGDKI